MSRYKWIAVVLVGCGAGNNVTANQAGGDDVEDPDDVTPPVIDFVPPDGAVSVQTDLVVSATIHDEDSAVLLASFHYRQETGSWRSLAMVDTGGDVWSTTVPAEELYSAGLYYWIEAVDESQNAAMAPEDGEADPYHLRLTE